MIGLVVTGHGHFADGIHTSAQMIAGENRLCPLHQLSRREVTPDRDASSYGRLRNDRVSLRST